MCKTSTFTGAPAESLQWSAAPGQSLAADVAKLRHRVNQDAARVAQSTATFQRAAEAIQRAYTISSNVVSKSGGDEGWGRFPEQTDSGLLTFTGLTEGLTSQSMDVQKQAKQLLDELIADQKELQSMKASIKAGTSAHAAEVATGCNATIDELLQQAKDAEQFRAAQREAGFKHQLAQRKAEFKAQLAQLQHTQTDLEQKLSSAKKRRSHSAKQLAQSENEIIQLQQQLAQRDAEVEWLQVELSDYPHIDQIRTLQQQMAELKRQRQPSSKETVEALAAKQRLQKCLQAERQTHYDTTHDYNQLLDGMKCQLEQAKCCQHQLVRDKLQQAEYLSQLRQQLASSEEAVQQLQSRSFSQGGTGSPGPAGPAAHIMRDTCNNQVNIATSVLAGLSCSTKLCCMQFGS